MCTAAPMMSMGLTEIAGTVLGTVPYIMKGEAWRMCDHHSIQAPPEREALDPCSSGQWRPQQWDLQ